MKRKSPSSAENKELFDAEYRPKLRNGVEPIPVRTEDGRLFVGLRDQMKLGGDILWISQELFYVLRFFNGRYSSLDIRSTFMRKFGKFLFEEDYNRLLIGLDENYLLDNRRSQERTRELTLAFRQLPARPAAFKDASYPGDPRELAKTLDDFAAQSNGTLRLDLSGKHIRAMVVPHIDPRLGGVCYAHAYKRLAQTAAADLFVILGTGHQPIRNLFSLTMQDFETPLGVVKTDRNLVKSLLGFSRYDFTADELNQRDEHSVEFQAVFLKHFVKSDFRILPVLCSFSHSIFGEGGEQDVYLDFIRALGRSLESYPGRVCFIASVDLAHVGPRYGDPAQQMNFAFQAQVEHNDRLLLDSLLQFDADAFQRIIQSTDNRYRICGYPALTTMMRLARPRRGELLDYSHASMDDMGSSVSFASMIFV